MPHQPSRHGSAADWLARANSDLAIAKVPLPEHGFYEDLCFHAQQAAEKALKAVYQHNGWTFRYTHDLDDLITGLKRLNLDVPENVVDADILSRFAWETRYPGCLEPISQDEYCQAVVMAETVLAWAEKQIAPH